MAKPLGKFLAVLLLSQFLASCQTAKEIAQDNVDVNRAAESAEDQVMLLNIVRAYEGRPRFYTDFSAMHGTLASFGAQGGQSSSALPTLTGSYTSPTTSFDITPLSKQEFLRGITTPIPLTTVDYYSQQGWFNSLLLHLFVQEIRVYRLSKDGDRYTLDKVFSNYPLSTTGYDAFDAVVNGLSACDLSVSQTPVSNVSGDDAIGPEIPKDKASDFKDRSTIVAQKLELVPWPTKNKSPENADNYLLIKQRSSRLRFLPRGTKESRDACLGAYDLATVPRPPESEYDGQAAAAPDSKPTAYMNIVMHSPEAMVLYLGETARAHLDGTYQPAQQGAAPANSEPRSIGMVHYSEGCFYYQGDGISQPCMATCVNLFELRKGDGNAAAAADTYCMVPAAVKCESDPSGSGPFPGPHKCTTFKSVDDGKRDSLISVEDIVRNSDSSTSTVEYSIPAGGAGARTTASLATLSILEQIFGMQTNATEIPSTSSVRVDP